MVLVVEKKFLEEDWWKYAVALFVTQMIFWILLGYRMNPEFTLWGALVRSRFVWMAFLFTAFMPFIAGRLQMRRLFWIGFIGFLLGAAAYFTLSIMKVGERFNLLPFIAFLQVYVACFSLGLLIELGRYVMKKLAE